MSCFLNACSLILTSLPTPDPHILPSTNPPTQLPINTEEHALSKSIRSIKWVGVWVGGWVGGWMGRRGACVGAWVGGSVGTGNGLNDMYRGDSYSKGCGPLCQGCGLIGDLIRRRRRSGRRRQNEWRTSEPLPRGVNLTIGEPTGTVRVVRSNACRGPCRSRW